MLLVVVGILFILLLLSLFATTIMELLASVLSLRGKNLELAIFNMLADKREDDELFQKFKNNALYQQMSNRFGSERPPSYLSDETFRTILFQELLQGRPAAELHSRVETLPEGHLKEVLTQLLNDVNGDVEGFKYRVRDWYNDVMDRASGWYKRNTQRLLLVVGLFIAVTLNADIITVFQRLQSDPELLAEVTQMADQFLRETAEIDTLAATGPQVVELTKYLKEMHGEQLRNLSSPLGLGWSYVDPLALTPEAWAIKVLGWIMTALAISLGAPFWFDLLRQVANVRSAGQVQNAPPPPPPPPPPSYYPSPDYTPPPPTGYPPSYTPPHTPEQPAPPLDPKA